MTDSISISDFYLKIAPFMANIKNGHSMMLPPFTNDLIANAKKDGKTMPLRIKASGDFFIVDKCVERLISIIHIRTINRLDKTRTRTGNG